MGWDQEYSVESVASFLQRLMGIEADFVAKEVRRRMEEKGLSIAKVEEIDRDEDDMAFGFGPYTPLLRITLSNGRVFVHKCVHSVCSDDRSRDDYELRDEKEDTEKTRENLE